MSEKENLEWQTRIFLDKTIKKAVQFEIEKLALAVLGNKKLKISHKKEGFDRYSYCKHETKQYCPVGNKTWQWMGSWEEWVVFGHTKTDVYLEVLKMLANDNSTYYPIVAFRQNDHWVEREKVEKYKED